MVRQARDRTGELEQRIAALKRVIAALVQRTDRHEAAVSALNRAALRLDDDPDAQARLDMAFGSFRPDYGGAILKCSP